MPALTEKRRTDPGRSGCPLSAPRPAGRGCAALQALAFRAPPARNGRGVSCAPRSPSTRTPRCLVHAGRLLVRDGLSQRNSRAAPASPSRISRPCAPGLAHRKTTAKKLAARQRSYVCSCRPTVPPATDRPATTPAPARCRPIVLTAARPDPPRGNWRSGRGAIRSCRVARSELQPMEAHSHASHHVASSRSVVRFGLCVAGPRTVAAEPGPPLPIPNAGSRNGSHWRQHRPAGTWPRRACVRSTGCRRSAPARRGSCAA